MSDRSLFRGASEMHERTRGYDWASTPLGPVNGWPHSLKNLVTALLASRYPMVLTWGPSFTQFYNDAYAKLIGDKHPAALGEDVRISLAEAWETLGPMIAQVMASGVANWTPALLLLLQRSGYAEESYFDVSHAPAEDDDGNVVGMMGVCSEVTAQTLSERRLRLLRELGTLVAESNRMHEASTKLALLMLDHPDVPFSVMLLGQTAATLEWAAAAGLAPELGHQLAAMRGWPLERALQGETVVLHDVPQFWGVRGGPWGQPVRSCVIMPIASARPSAPLGVLVAGLSPNRAFDEGYRSFFELLGSQVSVALRNAQAHELERSRADALAELDRTKTAFFSNVSHEFRTPLTLMLGPLEDALADTQENALSDAQRTRVELAHRSALRLFKLVNTLLDFTRAEAATAQLSSEPTDLAALTRSLVSLFESTIQRAGLELAIDIPTATEVVDVDRTAWEKIVLNLLSNAVKFTARGRISVALHRDGDRVHLTVRDTGAGIGKEHIDRIFDRFYRVEATASRSYEGSGIGLALASELVKMHGGEIRVESTVHEGSVFTVTLPRHRDDVRSAPAALRDADRLTSRAAPYLAEARGWNAPELGSPVPGPRLEVQPHSTPPADEDASLPRVLLVDDNPDLRQYLATILTPGFTIDVAVDGVQALQRVQEQPPDLILSDVMMPSLDGFGLLRALRADRRFRAIPFIMLSARAGEDAAVDGLRATADDYLVKPFTARELLARVNTQLAMSRIRRDVAVHEHRQRELQHAIELRDEFITIAAHELRTPVAALTLTFDSLLRVQDPNLVRARATSLARKVTGLRHLVENLVDTSQLIMGGLRLSRETLELVDLVQSAIDSVAERANRAGSPIALHALTSPRVLADRARMSQALTQLLANAIKHAAARPIEVLVAAAPDNASIAVVDHGIGVAEGDRERIFERFARATSTTHYGGFGLGLWKVRQIAEAHQGSVTAGETPGGGATFTLTLPSVARST